MPTKAVMTFGRKYPKLDKLQFTTVRWPDSVWPVCQVIQLWAAPEPGGHVWQSEGIITKIEVKRLLDLLYADFTEPDADCSPKEFYKFMEQTYGMKSDWRGKDSDVLVLTVEQYKVIGRTAT